MTLNHYQFFYYKSYLVLVCFLRTLPPYLISMTAFKNDNLVFELQEWLRVILVLHKKYKKTDQQKPETFHKLQTADFQLDVTKLLCYIFCVELWSRIPKSYNVCLFARSSFCYIKGNQQTVVPPSWARCTYISDILPFYFAILQQLKCSFIQIYFLEMISQLAISYG